MQYLKKLYNGSSVKKKDRDLIRALERKKAFPSLYILTVAAHEADCVDMYPVPVFYQSSPLLEELLVIGFAGGKEEAYEVAQALLETVLRETGTADVRGYLLRRERR